MERVNFPQHDCSTGQSSTTHLKEVLPIPISNQILYQLCLSLFVVWRKVILEGHGYSKKRLTISGNHRDAFVLPRFLFVTTCQGEGVVSQTRVIAKRVTPKVLSIPCPLLAIGCSGYLCTTQIAVVIFTSCCTILPNRPQLNKFTPSMNVNVQTQFLSPQPRLNIHTAKQWPRKTQTSTTGVIWTTIRPLCRRR